MAERKDASATSEPKSTEEPPKRVQTARYKQMSGFGMALSLAVEFAAAVAIFWFLGRLVDNWLDIEPWGQVTGGVIGWLGGILHVYVTVERRERRGKRT